MVLLTISYNEMFAEVSGLPKEVQCKKSIKTEILAPVGFQVRFPYFTNIIDKLKKIPVSLKELKILCTKILINKWCTVSCT